MFSCLWYNISFFRVDVRLRNNLFYRVAVGVAVFQNTFENLLRRKNNAFNLYNEIFASVNFCQKWKVLQIFTGCGINFWKDLENNCKLRKHLYHVKERTCKSRNPEDSPFLGLTLPLHSMGVGCTPSPSLNLFFWLRKFWWDFVLVHWNSSETFQSENGA